MNKIAKAVIAIIAILFVSFGIAVGIAKIALVNNVVDAIQQEINATPAPTLAYEINEETRVGDFIIVVNKPRRAVLNDYSYVPEGMEVIEIPIYITNISSYDSAISSTSFQMYKNNIACDDYIYGDTGFIYETISYGRSFQSFLYYQVPIGTEESVLELEYKYDHYGSKIIFKLN